MDGALGDFETLRQVTAGHAAMQLKLQKDREKAVGANGALNMT